MGGGGRRLSRRPTRKSSSCTSTGRKQDRPCSCDAMPTVRCSCAPRTSTSLRLKPPQEATIVIDGIAYFRVDAAMGADVRFDDATQSADLTLPANAFLPTVTALADNSLRPATVSPGAFLNYNLSTQQVAGLDESGALLELGALQQAGRRDELDAGAGCTGATRHDAPRHDLYLRHARAARHPQGRRRHQRPRRLGTCRALRRRAVRHELRYAAHARHDAAACSARRGRRAVDGRRVHQRPADCARGGATRAVRDRESARRSPAPASSRSSSPTRSAGSRSSPSPTTRAPRLLRAGLNEFSFEAGAIRNDYGIESFAYGDPFAAATFRRGITDSFTAEVHAETQADGANALGVDAAWQVGTLGVLTGDRRGRAATRTTPAGSPASASSAVADACTCSDARSSPPRSSCRSASPCSSRVRSSAPSPASASTSSASAPCSSPTGTRASGTRTRSRRVGASYSLTLGAYGFVSLFANHTRSPVLADRCVPGLDDAAGQSSQRRVEPVVPTRRRRR